MTTLERLRGSVTPVLTPFRLGEVDLDSFARLVERQVTEGSHGVLICGTTAEPSSLNLKERKELLRCALATVNGQIPVVAATGSQSFSDTLELSRDAQQAGADALLIVTPYYIKPPQDGLYQYFYQLASSLEIPWMIYHIPGRAAVSIETETVARLRESCPTLIGIKHAVNDLDFVSELLARLGLDFKVFCGLESLSLPMLTVGAVGLMNAVGNLMPAQVAALCDAVTSGDLGEARRLHYQLFELNRAIFLRTNPIPLKYMTKRLGWLESDEVRLPLAPVTSSEAGVLDSILQAAGLLEKTPA